MGEYQVMVHTPASGSRMRDVELYNIICIAWRKSSERFAFPAFSRLE